MHDAVWPRGLLLEWRQRIAADPVRRWGRWLLDVGIMWCFMAVMLPLPIKNVGFALVILGALLARPPINRLPGFWWAASAATLVVATTWWHTDDESAGALARGWLVAWLAAPVLVDLQRRRWALQAGLAAAAVAIALALAQTLVGYTVDLRYWHLAEWGERFARVGGFLHPVPAANLWVGVLAWLLPPAAILGLSRARLWEWRALVVLALLLTQVRMGLLAALVLVGLWWASQGRRYLLTTAVALPLVGLGLVGLLWLMDHPRMARMLQFEDGRWPIWRTGLAIVRDYPWFGVGPGQGLGEAYQARMGSEEPNEFFTGYFNLHNSPLTIMAQHGLVTLGLWLGTALALLWGLWRRGGPAARLTLALLGAVLVLGTFDHVLGRSNYHLSLWLALGLALALADNQGNGTAAGPPEIPRS